MIVRREPDDFGELGGGQLGPVDADQQFRIVEAGFGRCGTKGERLAIRLDGFVANAELGSGLRQTDQRLGAVGIEGLRPLEEQHRGRQVTGLTDGVGHAQRLRRLAASLGRPHLGFGLRQPGTACGEPGQEQTAGGDNGTKGEASGAMDGHVNSLSACGNRPAERRPIGNGVETH